MTCTLCGGRCEWQKRLTNLTHTKCLKCGEINCQEIEFQECELPEHLEEQLRKEPKP